MLQDSPCILIQAQLKLGPKASSFANSTKNNPPKENMRVKVAHHVPLKEIKFYKKLHPKILLAEWHRMAVVVKQIAESSTELDRSIIIRQVNAWMYVTALFLHSFIYFFLLYRDSNHPCCVSMLGIIDESDFFGFVSEYCVNGSLYLFYYLLFIVLHILEIDKER